MLHLILIAQVNIAPANLPASLLVPLNSTQKLDAPDQQYQRRKLQEQQLNLSQKRYQQKIKDLENLPSSRIDCFPLFPPASGYPPGVTPISCKLP